MAFRPSRVRARYRFVVDFAVGFSIRRNPLPIPRITGAISCTPQQRRTINAPRQATNPKRPRQADLAGPAGNIDKFATARVTLGCHPPVNDRFCPGSNVTRGQMAAFLHRALGYLWWSPRPLASDDPRPSSINLAPCLHRSLGVVFRSTACPMAGLCCAVFSIRRKR